MNTRTFARTAGWALAGQSTLIVFQAVSFYFVAHHLGAATFGDFAAVVALASLISPFAGWGAANQMVRIATATTDGLAVALSRAMRMTWFASAASTVLLILAARIALPAASLLLVICVGCSDLLCLRLLEIYEKAYLVAGHGRNSASVNMASSAMRAFAAIVLVMTGATSALAWGVLYALGSLAATVIAAIRIRRLGINRALAAAKISRAHVGEGLLFATSLAAQNVHNDIDKVILARSADSVSVGAYAAAYRLINVACTPLRALMYAAYPHVFTRGATKGAAGSMVFARNLTALGLAYAVPAGVALIVGRSLFCRILGSSYALAGPALLILAALPLLKVLHFYSADALTGLGWQLHRTAAQLIVAAFNVGLTIWWIRRSGWVGAAYASVASDASLATAMWVLLRLATRFRQQQSNPSLTEASAS